MMKIIFKKDAKFGEVTVTEYTENGHTEYKVKHSNPAIGTHWTQELFAALAHAQFLVAKY